MADTLETFGTFEVRPAQRELFRSGPLRKAWAEGFPFLFDAQDYQQAVNQPDYHFYEWLAAILMYEATGYHSLLSQYQFPIHRRKQELLQRLVDADTLELIGSSTRLFHAQCPDLLVYAPDLSDYFFCEVKGAGDRLREVQTKLFLALGETSKKRVCLVRFRMLGKRGSEGGA